MPSCLSVQNVVQDAGNNNNNNNDMADYIISEIYKTLIPPLSKTQFASLENSILARGMFNPIITNRNKVILDGYSRLQICIKNNIKPVFKAREFKSNYEEEIYVIETNLKRRRLNSFQVAELGQVLQKIEAKYSKQRKLSSLRQYDAEPKKIQNKKGKTASIVASNLGLSTTIYEKSLKIMKSDDDKLKSKVRHGKTTVQKAYASLVNKDKKSSVLNSLAKNQTRLPKSVSIYNKDFRDLKIRPESVSLIFTDPSYLKEDLPLYSDLGKQAMQVLRPGGSLMCFIGQFAFLEIMQRLQDEGLTFQWVLAVFHSGNKNIFFNKSIVQSWKPILWFTKGKLKKTKAVKDAIISKPPNKFLHKWSQSTEESDYYIEALTEKNDIVYDPFLGSGVFGLSARKLHRQFIGSEIDPVHFKTAQSVISQKL